MQRYVIALLLAATAGTAYADNGVYVGGSIGQSRLNPDNTRISFSDLNYRDKDEGFKLIAGIRPIDFIGAEISYVDFGRTNGFDSNFVGSPEVRAEARLFDAFAVGYIPLPFVDLFGKAGVARSTARYREDGISNLKVDSTDFAWGGGVQAHFGSIAGRIEYEKFNLPATRQASLVSVGVTWTFF
jgi:outer membrane immunogenic protein